MADVDLSSSLGDVGSVLLDLDRESLRKDLMNMVAPDTSPSADIGLCVACGWCMGKFDGGRFEARKRKFN